MESRRVWSVVIAARMVSCIVPATFHEMFVRYCQRIQRKPSGAKDMHRCRCAHAVFTQDEILFSRSCVNVVRTGVERCS